jgi:AcrR family transcriptional regulator
MAYRITTRGRARLREIERRVQRAASSIVAAKGFENARLDDIAEVAGVSPSAIYRFAAGRDELLADVVRHVSAKEREAFISALAQSPDPKIAVYTATRQFVQRAFANTPIAGALVCGPAVPCVDRAKTQTRALLADALDRKLGNRFQATAIVGALLALLAEALESPTNKHGGWAHDIATLCASLAS